MLIKMLLTITAIMISLSCFAETCPSPADLQQGKFNYWQALTLDNATELSDEEKLVFQHRVKNFAMAEWEEGAVEGEAHCYYHGWVRDRGYLNVFLVKQSLMPFSVYWKQAASEVLQCVKGFAECAFAAE